MKENGEETGSLNEEKLDKPETKLENSSITNPPKTSVDESADIPEENVIEEPDEALEKKSEQVDQELEIESSTEDIPESDDSKKEVAEKDETEPVPIIETPSQIESTTSPKNTEATEAISSGDSNDEPAETPTDVKPDAPTDENTEEQAAPSEKKIEGQAGVKEAEIVDKQVDNAPEEGKGESADPKNTEATEVISSGDSNDEPAETPTDVKPEAPTDENTEEQAEAPSEKEIEEQPGVKEAEIVDEQIVNAPEEGKEESADAKQNEKEEGGTHAETVVEEVHLDYTNYTKKQMVLVLESLSKDDNYAQVGPILKEIKRPYDEMANSERKAAYEKYIADGGEKDGFEYRADELDQRFQKAYSDLKDKRHQYFNSLEKQKDNNLLTKLNILEKIRELVDAEETGVSIKSLKELQKQWKEVGSIPSSQAKSLWANFNALLDRFYDQRSIYFELKELDRKKNYDLKIELCEKVEQLSEGGDIREVITHLNELHDEFKHIGPVPKEDQEVVWGRFKLASDKIYVKRKEYYEKLKEGQKVNEVAKEALIEKLLTFGEFISDRISDWNSKTKEIIAIQKEWEAIGSVPKEKAKSVNKLFWSAFKSFFNKKGQFFKKIEGERKENLKLKQELVEKANSLKDSEDFRKTSDDLKQLQKQWKDLGPVPEKFRNEVFLQFKKACDHFFDRRRTNSGKLDKDYEENLKKKQLLCEELELMTKSGKVDIARVKSIESEWNEIGFVPKSSIKSIQKMFTDAIAAVVDKVDISEAEKHKLRLSAQFNKTNYGPGTEKLLQKKEGVLRRQISNLENDINLWRNNIDFFAASKNADKLKAEFKIKIDKANIQLISFKEELKIIENI
jgi:hypothetical protein